MGIIIPSSLSTAFCASSAYLYLTNTKPLESPVLRFMGMKMSTTLPYLSKYDNRSGGGCEECGWEARSGGAIWVSGRWR